MANKLRTSGIIFAAIFFAGFLLNIVFKLQRGCSFVELFATPTQLSLLASVGVFLLSAFIEPLRYMQPALFLVTCPIPIVQEPEGLYGLGFFIMGVLLLERAGFFLRNRAPRLLAVLLYLLTVEIVAVVVSKRPLQYAVSPTFFIVAFGVFLWFLYKDRITVILREPRQPLSLNERGLSQAEKSFVMATLGGKSQKEIASDFELKESTIRNTLVRAYKKLGIEDRVGLAILGERYDIVE